MLLAARGGRRASRRRVVYRRGRLVFRSWNMKGVGGRVFAPLVRAFLALRQLFPFWFRR